MSAIIPGRENQIVAAQSVRGDVPRQTDGFEKLGALENWETSEEDRIKFKSKQIAKLNKTAANWNIQVSGPRMPSKTLNTKDGAKFMAQQNAMAVNAKVKKSDERRQSGNHLIVKELEAYTKRMKQKVENSKYQPSDRRKSEHEALGGKGDNRGSGNKRGKGTDTMPKSSHNKEFSFNYGCTGRLFTHFQSSHC